MKQRDTACNNLFAVWFITLSLTLSLTETANFYLERLDIS